MREHFQSQLESPINQTKENPRVFYVVAGKPENCLLSEVDSLGDTLKFKEYQIVGELQLPVFTRKRKKPSS